MIKLNSLEEMMQEHCSRIYWGVDSIKDNIMFIVAELNNQGMSTDTEEESRSLLSEYLGAITFLHSEAIELGEKFAWFISNPEMERLNLEEQSVESIIDAISDILNKQTTKFDHFLKILDEKEKLEKINGITIILFFESGGNILREKGEIINSLNFLANNYKRYQYEINSKNSKIYENKT